MTKEWVKKGYFLDFENVKPEVRPFPDYRFVRVIAQQLTEIRGLSKTLNAYDEVYFDFGAENLKDLLEPQEDMVFQCAFGFYPDEPCYIIHPSDYEQRKLPSELPSSYWRVGILRMVDSPYYAPNLEKTEFWIFKEKGYYAPKIRFKEIYGKDVTVYLRVLVNVLVVEPVKDKELISLLERGIKPSTPVYAEVFRG